VDPSTCTIVDLKAILSCPALGVPILHFLGVNHQYTGSPHKLQQVFSDAHVDCWLSLPDDLGRAKGITLQHASEHAQCMVALIALYCSTFCVCIQIMQGEQGVVAHVKLPPQHELDRYDKLELDFTLGCPGLLMSICISQVMQSVFKHQLVECCRASCICKASTSKAALLSLPYVSSHLLLSNLHQGEPCSSASDP